MQEAEIQLEEENTELDGAIGDVRTDIESLKKELEAQKKTSFNSEQELNKYQGEIQRHKFAFKQISENGKYRIKEHVEKNRYELENLENRIANQ